MKTFGPTSAKTSATSASHSRTGKPQPGRRLHRHEQDEDEAERREEEGRLPLREADGHLGGVEAEEQPAQHVDTVLGGDGDRLDGAVVGQQRLLADRRREPGTGERALEGQDEEPRGHGQPGQQPLAARRGGRGAAQARGTQDQGHGQALGARQRHERPRHGEAGGAPAAPPGRASGRAAAGRGRGTGRCPSRRGIPRRPVRRGRRGRRRGAPRARRRGAWPRAPRGGSRRGRAPSRRERRRRSSPSPRAPSGVGEGQDRGVEEARGARGRRLAGVVLEGVALGHRLRVLRDHVEVAHLGHEVAAGRPQQEAEEGRGDGQPEQEEGAHGPMLAASHARVP